MAGDRPAVGAHGVGELFWRERQPFAVEGGEACEDADHVADDVSWGDWQDLAPVAAQCGVFGAGGVEAVAEGLDAGEGFRLLGAESLVGFGFES
ncbi:hypothetical protein GCM10017774_00730 [Lentzea cavernae]|uniref:Uncharacterized protein n=1 Tax=Lentzea cavernae TaxID=2020703 RepID=A0ABQ3LXD7_9PSEU|nr:hypothetical protein GCM10017774_00730 [Lentzea cavernae]